MMNRLQKLLGLVITLLLLAACSGGGGDSTTTTPAAPTGSSNWDQLKWDQDNWA